MLLHFINFISKLHGHSHVFLDIVIESILKLVIKTRILGSFESFRTTYISSYKHFPATQKFLHEPERFLQYMAMIQRTPTNDEKGVLTIAYNYAIPSFMYMFDYEEIMKRYHIVLEPSTARLLMPEILICDQLKDNVYVQTGEPRDRDFIARYSENLKPISIAANWWLNTNVFKYDAMKEKKYDIVMVSTFTKLKRHYLLFNALKKLKSQGVKLKAVLVGYQGRYSKQDILNMAKYAGVEDQVDIFENLSPEETAHYYQVSKVNILLSKREGTPRTIIEGLHCGTPAMLRNGFNFNYKYPFITETSGAYFNDSTLAQDIMILLNKVDNNKIDTLKIVRDLQIEPYNASVKLNLAIYNNKNLNILPKASGLHGMEYLTPNTRSKLNGEYDFLLLHFKRT